MKTEISNIPDIEEGEPWPPEAEASPVIEEGEPWPPLYCDPDEEEGEPCEPPKKMKNNKSAPDGCNHPRP